MEWIQLLENDKEQLMGDLAKAVSPENAQRVLEKEMDRLLMQYNEDCGEERLRDAARYMAETAKMMIPMISTANETKIWSGSSSHTSGSEGHGIPALAIACLAGGILMLAGGLFSMISFADGGIPAAAFFSAIPAAILGGGLLFLGGRLSLSKKTGDTSADSKVEIRIDPAGVWSCLRGVMLSIDKSLGEAQEVLSYERSRIKPSSGSLLSPEEAELFSGILESAYSRREEEPDDPSAQETISMVCYYLHRRQVETVEYGGGKREWFELLPGQKDMTMRPALVKDGTLIRKGLAVTSQ